MPPAVRLRWPGSGRRRAAARGTCNYIRIYINIYVAAISLEHILLGSLRTPASGYQLGREFVEGARHFWFAELSQIYPTLKRLEARGWLKGRDRPSERGPARRVYELTAAGRKALRHWLSAGPHIGRERLAYLAQVYFLDALDDVEAALEVIRRMQAVWRQKLAALEAMEAALVAEYGDWPDHPPELFFPFAALRNGLYTYRAKLAWCDETIARLTEWRDARAAAKGE
jgi:PadR family transcriptional regulator AphA